MVSIYELDEEKAFTQCSVLQFESANEAWLDFVSENRAGNCGWRSYKGADFGGVENQEAI